MEIITLEIQSLGLKVSMEELHGILNEIDTSYNGRLELSDYLQVQCWASKAEFRLVLMWLQSASTTSIIALLGSSISWPKNNRRRSI